MTGLEPDPVRTADKGLVIEVEDMDLIEPVAGAIDKV